MTTPSSTTTKTTKMKQTRRRRRSKLTVINVVPCFPSSEAHILQYCGLLATSFIFMLQTSLPANACSFRLQCLLKVV